MYKMNSGMQIFDKQIDSQQQNAYIGPDKKKVSVLRKTYDVAFLIYGWQLLNCI